MGCPVSLRAGLRPACVVLGAALVACGGGSPTSPEPVPSIVALGPQVLRISVRPGCALPPGVGWILARVTVTPSGRGWLASASTPDAGDVQLHFEPSGGNNPPSTIRIVGTITGTVIHMPELLPVPSGGVRANFGAGGGTLDGVAFTAGSLTAPSSGVDGVGTGSLIVTPDATGESCTASSFSWSIFPPQ